jgi:carboxymethylenebutenolidase
VEGLTQDIRAAYDWLQGDPQVRKDAIASIGFCMGGRASFLANATVPLQAAISFYGGGIAPALLPQVATLHAPMLFFWGGRDKHIGQEQIRAVIDECKRLGKPYVNVEISDADHGFFCDARASYHPEAANLAWGICESFLHFHVHRPELRKRVR